MASLSLKNVCKVYPNGFEAVKDFNLDVADKEFIIFVGPSGCGKSTTLRMIAGLEEISSGDLIIDGKVMNDVEPKDRDIAMVFQNYALYPHMTVFDSPQKLYNEPNNLFVAGFIGSPQMNFIDAKCTIQGDKATLTFGDYSVVLPDYKAKKLEEGGYNGKTVVLGIRPEDISDDSEMIQKNGDCVIESDVTGYELLGAEVLLYYSVAGANMTARVDSDTPARYGDHIKLAFDPHKIHVFDKETELTITN